MYLDVVVGLQRGDEGKGKIVQFLSAKDDYVYCARFNGSSNAGHSIYINGQKVITHLIPTGIFNDNIKKVFLSKGMVIDPIRLLEEIDEISTHVDVASKLIIDPKVTLVQPTHYDIELAHEESSKSIGTTRRGVGPAYASKYERTGLRFIDFIDNFSKALESLPSHDNNPKFIRATKTLLDKYDFQSVQTYLLNNPGNVLCEGAQGYELDIESDMYPYVSSSHALATYAPISLGLSPKTLRKVYGVVKPYSTYVGNGSYHEQLKDDISDILRKVGEEYGATTGRPRKIGAFNLEILPKAIYDNQVSDLVVTKVDTLLDFMLELVKIKQTPYLPVLEKTFQLENKVESLMTYKYFNKNDIENIESIKKWARNYFLPFFDQIISEKCLYEARYITPIPKISYLSIGPNLDDIIELF